MGVVWFKISILYRYHRYSLNIDRYHIVYDLQYRPSLPAAPAVAPVAAAAGIDPVVQGVSLPHLSQPLPGDNKARQ